MIIAIASDNGANVVPLTDASRAFVLFEVARATAVRAGYRSNGNHKPAAQARLTTGASVPSLEFDRQSLVETLSDCSAVIACEIDTDLERILRGKAIKTFVCGEENVDLAAQRYAASLPEGFETDAVRTDSRP